MLDKIAKIFIVSGVAVFVYPTISVMVESIKHIVSYVEKYGIYDIGIITVIGLCLIMLGFLLKYISLSKK